MNMETNANVKMEWVSEWQVYIVELCHKDSIIDLTLY